MIRSQIISKMTGREIIDAMSTDTPLARVHRIIADGHGELDQAGRQRNPEGPIEIRRMELQIANRVLALFGIALP